MTDMEQMNPPLPCSNETDEDGAHTGTQVLAGIGEFRVERIVIGDQERLAIRGIAFIGHRERCSSQQEAHTRSDAES